MTTSDFSRSLLRSAKTLDAPAAGAKARAAEHVVANMAKIGTTAAAATVAKASVTSAKVGIGTWLAAAGAIAVVGASGYVAGRSSAPPTPVPVAKTVIAPDTAPAPPSEPQPSPSSRAASPVAEASAPEPNACMMHTLPDTKPTKCAVKGKPVPAHFKNGCGADVDVFWVDQRCDEVFHARLAPGQTFQRTTQDGQVWRVRDHATHALLKDLVVQALPGMPEVVDHEKRAQLPPVVLHAGDPALPDSEPAVCSGAGTPATLTVQNDRDESVVLMWVGIDCKEKYYGVVEPKKKHTQRSVESDAWRVRDAKTGALLADVVPSSPDWMVYVSVP